jgi:nucleotide-binding universal stress UspA family protein
MFKKIVWATDGSESSDRALDYVRALAREGGAPVVVAHCKEILLAAGRSPGPVTLNAAEDELLAKLETQVAELKAEGIEAKLRVGSAAAGSSNVAQVIREIAAEEGADLIVAGTRGHSAIGELVLGSVTHRLLSVAECPVLVIPPAAR